MKKLYITYLLAFFVGILQLFAHEANTSYAHNKLGNTKIYIDNSVKDIKLLPIKELSSSSEEFYLFSHGRSGELFIDGQWKNVFEIEKWFFANINILEINHINIYGCEFAKGEKGLQAVSYLEKELGVAISASNNITGKDGDWNLEVGAFVSINGMEGYNGNLQCASGGVVGGTEPNDDFDGDGVCNSVDLDDDNDGILDKIECPGGFSNLVNGGGFTTNPPTSNWYFANGTSNYHTPFSSAFPFGYGSTQKNSTLTGGLFDEVDGVNTATVNLNALMELNGATDALVSALSMPLIAGVTYNLSFDAGLRGGLGAIGQNLTVKLYNADANTVEAILVSTPLTSLPAYSSTPNYKTLNGFHTVSTSGNYYLLFLNAGHGGPENDYVIDRVAFAASPSAGVCDTDHDGIPNHLDLDSDGDGCTDADEAGTAAKAGAGNTSTGTLVNKAADGGTRTGVPNAIVGNGISTDYGANGFYNGIESIDNQTATYTGTGTSAYSYNKAIDALTKACCPVVSNNTIGSDQTVCSNIATVMLTGSLPTLTPNTGANITYQWMSSPNLMGVFTNINGNGATEQSFSGPITQTTYYKRVVTVNCSTSSSNTSAVVKIVVMAAPNAGTLTSSAGNTICVNGTTTVSSNGDAGGSWSSSDETIATVVNGVVSGKKAGMVTITYTVAATSPCSTASISTITINVKPLPTATMVETATTSVCSGTGTTVSLTGTPNAVVSYTINGVAQSATLDASGKKDLSTGNLIANAIYKLTSVTNAGSEVPSCERMLNEELTITVTPNNTVSAGSPSPTICKDVATGVIIHNTTGATGVGTPTGLPAGVTASWIDNMIVITGTPTVSGSFNYSIPLTGGCGNVNATGTITVKATCDDFDKDGIPDVVDIDDDNDGVLDTVEQTCNDTGQPLYKDYRPGVWVGKDGLSYVSYLSPIGTYVAGYQDNGSETFTFTLTDLKPGIVNTLKYHYYSLNVQNPDANSVTLSINDIVKHSFTTVSGQTNPPSYTVDQGYKTVTFTPTSTTANVKITWSTPNNGQIGSDAQFREFQVNGETKYDCTDNDTDNDGTVNRLDLDSDGDGCTDADEAGTVTQAGAGNTSTGTLVNKADDEGIRVGVPNAIVGNGMPANYGNNGFYTGIESDDTQTATYTGTGTSAYTYNKAIDALTKACCPVVSNNTIGSDQTVCSNVATVTLTGSLPTLTPNTGANITYQWMSSPNLMGVFTNINGNGATEQSFSGSITQTTYYKRVVTVNCSTSSSNTSAVVKVTVTAAPNAGTLTSSAGNTICVNGTTTVSGNGDAGGSWSGSDETIATVVNGVVSGKKAGMVTITYTVAATSPCSTASISTITINVKALPTATMVETATTSICSGTGTTVSLTGTPNAVVSYTINGVAQSATLDASGKKDLSTGNLIANAIYKLTSVTNAGSEVPSCERMLNEELTITVTPATNCASISLQKSAKFNDINGNGKAEVGETISYSFKVKNTGSLILTNITISDPLVTVSGSIASLAPGAEDITTFTAVYTIKQSDIDAGKVTNQATATGTTPDGTPVTATSNDPSTLDPGDGTTTVLPVKGSISLEKTAKFNDINNNGKAEVGETITYSFKVKNTGNVTLTNITISDPLVTVSGSIASLAAGAEDGTTFTAVYTIKQSDIDAGKVTNQATATGTTPDGTPVTATSNDPSTLDPGDGTTTVLPVKGSMSLDKIAVFNDLNGNKKAEVGETITYSFKVKNTGNVTLTNITISDPLVTVSGSIASLAPGAEDITTFTAVYTIKQSDIDAGKVTNQATATGTTPDGTPVTATSNDPSTLDPGDGTTTVLPVKGSMSLDKIAVFNDLNGNKKAEVGETITYSFKVKNTGNVTLTNITISDPLVTVSGSIASLAPGAEDITTFTAVYTIKQSDIDAGKVTNQATATGTTPDGTPVTATSNDPSTLDPGDGTTTVLPVKGSMSLDKIAVFNDLNGNKKAEVGETITYSFKVKNTGNVTLTNITISDPLVTVSGSIASLAAGAEDGTTFTAVYTIKQSDIDAGKVTNQATATGTTPDGTPVTATSNDPSTLDPGDGTTTVLPVKGSISLEKTAKFNDINNNGKAEVGETITYSFKVKNTGNVTLTNITISDPLVTVSGSIASLAPGAEDGTTFTAVYTIKQSDIDAGKVTNQATATGTTPDGTPVTATSNDPSTLDPGDGTTTVLPVKGSISLEKTAKFNDINNNGKAEVGETITYSFKVKNTGNVTLTNITISDPLVTVSGSIASLAPGAEDITTFTAVYTIKQSDIDAGKVTNQATATGTTPDGTPVTATSNDPSTLDPGDGTTTVLPVKGSISLDKTAKFNDINNNGKAEVGETITYSFKVKNTGNVTLTNITISDPLVTVSGSIASLAAGAEDITTFTAVYTIKQSDIDAGKVTNQATATGTTPDGTPVTATSNDPSTLDPGDGTTTVLPVKGSISLDKTAKFNDINNNGKAEVGETITYSFKVKNTGNVTLTNITISDPLVTVSGSIASLAAGAEDITTFTAVYTIKQSDIDAGKVTNQATATGTTPDGTPVTATSNDPSTLDPGDGTTTVLPVKGSMSLDKIAVFNDLNGNKKAEVGETITYSFKVKNTGNVTLTNITISDPLVTVSGSIASLAPGAEDITTFTAVYTIKQSDIDAGKVTNQATATGTTPDGTPVTATSNDPSTLDPGDGTTTVLPVKGSMSLDKIAVFNDLNGNKKAEVGETITYSFKVKNTGNVTLTNITISDPLVTVSGSIASLAAGAEDGTTFTAVYTIKQSDIDAGKVTNQATATGTTPDGTPVTATSNDPSTLDPGDGTTTVLPVKGSISLEKTAKFNDINNNGKAEVGETITYSFKVKNTGNVTLTNITISDPLVTVSGSIASLAPGAEDGTTFTAVYTIKQSDIDAGKVTNQATATGTTPDGTPVTATSNDPSTLDPGDGTTTVLPVKGSISLEKTAKFNDINNNGKAEVGETITYSFKVKNTGNVTLTNITISDPLVTVSGSIASLAAGAEDGTTFTAVYTIKQSDIDAGKVTNQATATGTTPDGTPVTATSNDPSTLDPGDGTTTVLPVKGSISLEKIAKFNDINNNGKAEVGETITYSFKVKNTGNVTLTNITISDPLVTVSGSIASLAAGAEDGTTFTAVYTIKQSDIDAGKVTNQATATGTTPDGTPVTATSNDPSTLDPGDGTTTVLPVKGSISLDKTAKFNDINNNGKAEVGETITYSFKVKNTGNVTLTNITISDPLVTVSGSIASLAPGAEDITTFTAVYTIKQSDIDAGKVTNQATATGTTPDGPVTATSNDPSTLDPGDGTTTVLPVKGSISLEKAAKFNDINNNGKAEVGETITYSFKVTNTGNVILKNIKITDPLVTVAGGPIAELAPGASDATTFTATYKIKQSDIDASKVTNQAFATGTPPSGPDTTVPSDDPKTPTIPNDPTETLLESKPGMSLDKTAKFNDINNNGKAEVGETITYSFKVKNTGNVTLTNITISDPLVTVSGNIASLAPGAEDAITFTAVYTVKQSDIDGGKVTNQATGRGVDPSGNPVTATSDDPSTLIPGDGTITVLPVKGSMSIAKTAKFNDINNNGKAEVGETITYSFKVKNTGNVILTNITISDPLVTVSGKIASLAPGAEDAITFTAVYIVKQSDVDAGKVTNQATGRGVDPSGNPVTATSDDPSTPAPEDPTITPLPNREPICDVSVLKTVDNAVPLVGNNVTFTISAANEEGDDAFGVIVNEILPSGYTLVSAKASGTTTYNSGVWKIGSLKKGDKALLTVVAKVNSTGNYTNTVTISSITKENNLLNNTSSVTPVPVPNKPVAVDDVLTINVNQTVNAPICYNDNPGNSTWDYQSMEIIDQPKYGTVKLNYDGTITYIPKPGNIKEDSFTYRIKDVFGNYTNIATVVIKTNLVDLKIPNLFTPNGDGNNDTFEIIGLDQFSENSLVMVNRWGNEIYKINGYQNNWSGEGLGEGTYYYLLKVRNASTSDWVVYKGWLMLIRDFKK